MNAAVENKVTTSPADGAIGAASWDLYWRQVERTLVDVFGGGQASLAALANMRSRVEKSSESLRASVYHLDPLQVAADLAGAGQITAQQRLEYGCVLRDTSNQGPSGYRTALLDEAELDHRS